MFFLLGISGMPIISHYEAITAAIAVIFTIFYLWEKRLKVDWSFWMILGSFAILITFQATLFNFFRLSTVLGLFLKLWIAYLGVKLLWEKFPDYFINQMVFFSLVSFIFFIPIFLYPPMEQIIMDMIPSFLSYPEFNLLLEAEIPKKSLIIYEFNTQAMGDFGLLVRNCGPFWEAGALAGYVVLAYMFNTIRQRSFINRNNNIFLITLLSTQSTTGFVCLFAFLLVVFLIYYEYLAALKVLVVGALFVGAVMVYYQLTFLSAKIAIEFENIKTDIERGGDSRVASAILDWRDISRFPLTGRGIWDETRIDAKFKYVLRNNGLTNLAARWGVIFFFIYFYWFYRSLYEYCHTYKSNLWMAVAILLIIWVASFSEDYYESPFFLSMLFWHEPFKNTVLLVRDQFNNLRLA